mgnify:CR=1 FL=1
MYFYIYIYININFLFHPFSLRSRLRNFGLSVSVSADLLHDPPPKKNPPKEVVSQILFVTLPCLSLDFLFLFATRRYVEFFDMARPWAAFVAQDIKSIINYSAAE